MTLATHAPVETIHCDFTQKLRNLIEDSRHGVADTADLHQALDALETHYGVTPTTATDQGRTV